MRKLNEKRIHILNLPLFAFPWTNDIHGPGVGDPRGVGGAVLYCTVLYCTVLYSRAVLLFTT